MSADDPQNPSLMPGTRLGPYEIGARIGVGGMGHVYRATDTKLRRQVAVNATLVGLLERLGPVCCPGPSPRPH